MNEKAVIEALLFVSDEPVSKNDLMKILKDVKEDKIRQFIDELNTEYAQNGHSFLVSEIAGGWQLRTRPEFGPWIKELLNAQHRERMSASSLETLAIIAYKQPITKSEIEAIRGVNADYILHSLIERNLVKVVGHKNVIGRPFLYGTTNGFLLHFGLSKLEDLPEVSELKKPGGKDGVKEPAQGD